MQDGSSGNECSETYRGSSAASEPETQNTANYFKFAIHKTVKYYAFNNLCHFFRSLGNIVGAIDWHSFSQLILRPYGMHYNIAAMLKDNYE